jgi:uncharacterized membrane protein YeaQ/YmgE (transglycosylase-associated protein family)
VHIPVWPISGIIAGWITGLVVRGEGFSLVGDLIVGLLGRLIGSWLFGLLGIATVSWMGEIVAAIVAGVILVAIVRTLRRG